VERKLRHLCIFALLMSHACSFAMLSRISSAFRAASRRLRSHKVEKFLNEPSSLLVAQLEDYAEIVDSPMVSSQEVAYSQQEYVSMGHGFNGREGELRGSHCPFFASLCNESNQVSDEHVMQAIDELKQYNYDIASEVGQDLVYDHFSRCNLHVPFDALYHAVRMNKSLDVIKKLVSECDCDPDFHVIRNAPDYEMYRIGKIVLCPTPLFWAFLHGNYDVAIFLMRQGVNQKWRNIHGKTAEGMKDIKV